MLVAGFLLPLQRALRNGPPISRAGTAARWEGWIYAPFGCVAAAFLFVIVRIASWLPSPASDALRNGELRELCVAWFLMWYLISFAVRMRRVAHADGS